MPRGSTFVRACNFLTDVLEQSRVNSEGRTAPQQVQSASSSTTQLQSPPSQPARSQLKLGNANDFWASFWQAYNGTSQTSFGSQQNNPTLNSSSATTSQHITQSALLDPSDEYTSQPATVLPQTQIPARLTSCTENADDVLTGHYRGTNSHRSPGQYSTASGFWEYSLYLYESGTYVLNKTSSISAAAAFASQSYRHTDRETGTWYTKGKSSKGTLVLTDSNDMFLDCPYFDNSSDPSVYRIVIQLGSTYLRYKGPA